MEHLHCTATLPRGYGHFNSCNALLGGRWAVELVQCTAQLPWGSGQCNSCNALPHSPGGVGNATLAMHCHNAWGQWAVELVQRIASMPGGSGQCNSFSLFSWVGDAIPAPHPPRLGITVYYMIEGKVALRLSTPNGGTRPG